MADTKSKIQVGKRVREKYEEIPAHRIATWSNFISILRATLALPIIYFLNIGDGKTAFIFMVIAIISDMLDGWLARVSNEITELGKVLDPFADKVVIFSVMIYLASKEAVPLPFFGFLVLRDLTISLMAIYTMNNRSITPHANKLGKVSIVFTVLTILYFIYSYRFETLYGQIQFPLVAASMFFMTISWIQYVASFLNVMFGSDKNQADKKDPANNFSNALLKTEKSIAARLPLLGKFFTVDEDLLDSIEETLLAADLGVALTDELIANLKQVKKSEKARLQDILKTELKKLVDHPSVNSHTEEPKPKVILMVGVNGTGKTTSIGKLSHRLTQDGKSVMVAAADTFRAAAYEQLKVWAERSGVEFIGNPNGNDPAAVAFDAVKAAKARNADVVLIDTAGRLHTKSNLMDELSKMKRVIQKVMPDAPHEIWLVLDATTGQNGLQQARQFLDAVGVTGLVLTKLDGTAKGGMVLAIHKELNIPVQFIGTGEKIDDLAAFEPDSFIDALLENK